MQDELNANLLYFTRQGCNVCTALLPKIKFLMASKFPQFPLRVVDIEKETNTAAKHMVFTIPTLILRIEDKEYLRKSRLISLVELESQLTRISQLQKK